MIKVYLDPGHGGNDPGAVKYIKERDMVVNIANMTAEFLKEYDCETKISKGTTSTIQRAQEANKWGANLFFSFHANAGGGDGFEAWLYDARNVKLGNLAVKHVKAAGQNSRGVKYSKELNILRLTNMPAILTESAFVDNKKDIQEWDTKAEQKKLAEAYGKTIVEYLGLKKVAKEFKVKVLVNLNVRSGPGTEYKVNKVIRDNGIYTITEVKGNWGKLKSGSGWINTSAKYCRRM